MKKGTYTATNSDLYYKVHKVHHISDRTGLIKLKATVFYKSTNEICRWLCPYGAKNFKLLHEVVKHWEYYEL